MNYLIAGLGLIGRQRLRSLLSVGINPNVIGLVDIDPDINLDEFPKGLKFETRIDQLDLSKITHAILSTPHDMSKELVTGICSFSPRILLEKPLGRNLNEATEVISILGNAELSIGFNYRFMDGITKLKNILQLGMLGKLNSIRMDLGHGGSPGDDKSWKLNKESAGGGSLLDPGIHLIDLLLFLLNGDSSDLEVDGSNTWSGFWNTGIEESALALGKFKGIPFQLASSIVAWRTRFSIEIIGSDGYVIVSGRGRSDGPQILISGTRWGWMSGKTQIESETHEVVMQKDHSIDLETRAWLSGEQKVANSSDGLEAMRAYDKFLRKIS